MKFIKDMSEKNKCIVSLVLGVVLGIVVSLMIPNGSAKLSNGKEVIVSLNNKENITAEDLYGKLKDKSGLDSLLSIIDEYIMKDYYKDDKEAAASYAEEQAEYYYSLYSQYYNMSKEEFLSSNNLTEKEFIKYLEEEYYYQQNYTDYVKSIITDEEITEEYEKNYFSNRTVEVLYSDDKSQLENALKEYKKGTSVDKIKKKYTKVSSDILDPITYDDSKDYTDTFISKIMTDTNNISKVFEDDNYGYAFVSITDITETKALSEVKENILDKLVANKKTEDSNLYYQAAIKLREKYNLKFYDTNLEKEYKDYINSYK